MVSTTILQLLATALAFASVQAGHPAQAWREGKFKTLVTFGDSYTDENRLGYFIQNNGTAPPVGWDQPVGLTTASGGRSWARYASVYSSAKLYNYAVSGAVCSNKITPRPLSPTTLFPDIEGYELPAFIADSKYTRSNGTKFFTGKSDSTVYAIWIGTNDLGNGGFVDDSQQPGKIVSDYMDCVYNTVDGLYANGGQYFVLLNLAPLDLLPQYQLPSQGGLSATQFWPANGRNVTDVHYRMQNTVAALNDVYGYRTPFVVEISKKYPGIKMASFNVNGLMTDIHSNPTQYLNGTAPLNVTGTAKTCATVSGQNCTVNASPDSFEWFDPLHPSEQTSRIVAREFVNVLGGKGKWGTYWG
ncbi:uncharacterized protein EKO05_0011013 [Ascochyta rabiei]|uniref:Hydrolase n=1 Tax=Didymella rabiei TaxID=5454 RepID=A0A163LI74_DIDRA|nr:uncharacterized protein EKO05_0011013 [Ascochyta rabiei]KZM27820.1 hydrolase [Ascochyta rabiei]UPX20793.1 hypothetical protein EKO05_0011013 [Ascochyta rabiei]